MALSNLLKNLFSKEDVKAVSRLNYQVDGEGLCLTLPAEVFNQARQGYADDIGLHQYLRMQMLLEEDIAQLRENGIYLSGDDAAALDEDSRHIFNLPPRWGGRFRLQSSGLSHEGGFQLDLFLEAADGEFIKHYTLDGPLLRLSESECFLPDTLQRRALETVAAHRRLTPAARTEYANLSAVHQLIEASAAGLDIERAAFEKFSTSVPEQVGLAAEILPDGSLELMPTFGEGLEQDAVLERLGQLDPEGGAQSLRVGHTIVLLDEERLRAAHEIIRKRHIPASQRRRFLAAPASYLDAALINLDAGLSLRVKGAGPFHHAYFGETDCNDVNWFSQEQGIEQDIVALLQNEEPEKLAQPADLTRIITDPAVLGDFREKLADAEAVNATVLHLDQWKINISDRKRVYQAIEQLEEIFAKRPPEEEEGPLALDIHLNDMDTDVGGEMNAPVKGIQSSVEINFDAYTRSPFPHQVEGVRWMLALARNEGQPEDDAKHRIQGALLADDMGLGKTYMSIVGLREILLHTGSNKPVLVVAPLSLLENWKRETAATYKEPFFERIVILQSDGDLPKFRVDGRGVETKRPREHDISVEAPAELPEDGESSDIPPWEDEAGAENQNPPTADENVARENEAAERPSENIEPAAPSAETEGAGEDERAEQAEAEEEQSAEDFFARHCSLKVGPEWGPDRLDLPATMVLATYQTLRDYQFSLARIPWSVVVFDEAQNIKSPNTLQSRAAKALNAEFKLMVTGTPVENHLGELWCLFDTMQPGFLGSYQSFRNEYIRPILKAPPDELEAVREDIGKSLRERVGGFMLRRIKEDHLKNLPQKHIILGEHEEDGRFVFDPRISGVMGGAQRLRYEDIMQVTLTDMEDADASSGAALRGLQQLRDASLHPALLTEMPAFPRNADEARAFMQQSGKLSILLKILDDVRERDEKILIFAVNKRLQELVSVCVSKLYQLPVAIINGSTKAVSNNPNNPTRQAIIDRFQATEGFNALVISPVAAGVGLTITAANNVVHLERHWNPAKEAQATDRAYRIGQTKDVFVYVPILMHPDYDSFDVNLNRLLMSKTSLKDAIITQEEVKSEELSSGVFGAKKNSK